MERICEYEACRKPFQASRSDARFHSAACRAKASKARTDDEPATTGADAVERLEERVLDLEVEVKRLRRPQQQDVAAVVRAEVKAALATVQKADADRAKDLERMERARRRHRPG